MLVFFLGGKGFYKAGGLIKQKTNGIFISPEGRLFLGGGVPEGLS